MIVRLIAAVACLSATTLPAQVPAISAKTDMSGSFPVTRVTGEPPEWRLDSIATIRDVNGAGFRALRAILLDPDGTTWAADYAAKLVHHYGATGNYLGAIGRATPTTSIFGMVSGIGWVGDTLLVYDPGNGRAVMVTRSGKVTGQFATSHLRGGDDVRFYEGGRAASWLFQAVPRGAVPDVAAFVRILPTGHYDTVMLPRLRPLPVPPTAECSVTGGTRSFASPFNPEYRIAPTASGRIVVLDPEAYRLILYSPWGDTSSVIERTVARAAVADGEWKAGTADYVRTRASAKSCVGDLQRPDMHPAARALAVDGDGQFWVERIATDGPRWEVWQESNLVASVRAPRRATDIAVDIRGDRLAVAREGIDGSYSVIVFRIVRP